MTQNLQTSGENASVQGKLNEFLAELDKQTNAILPIKNPVDSSIEEVLNLTYEQLSNIDQQECQILCYKLSQYATYIQKVYNRNKNIRRWAESNINVMVGKYGGQYGDKWMKFEEKRNALIADNEYVRSLAKLALTYSSLEDELFEIADRVRYISQALIGIKNVK
jgi:uncharacterized HAD superfamily protein